MINGMFGKTKNLIRGLSLLFLGWALTQGSLTEMIGIENAHAQNALGDDFMNIVSQFVGIVLIAMNLITWILFRFLDLLLDPFFIFDLQEDGSDGALLQMLHDIWQLSRDLMNLIFALILVIAAIYTIVTAKREMLKTYGAKFVMAVILVNFSWFVPRAVYDLSQVTAATVFQLPSILNITCVIPLPEGQVGPPKPCTIITRIILFEETRHIVMDANAQLTNNLDGSTGWACPLPGILCYQEKFETDPGANMPFHSKVLHGLVVNHAHLKELAWVSNPAIAGPPAPEDGRFRVMLTFIMKMVLVLAIHLAMFLALLALAVAFFLRIPILWITIAFMPFAFLGLLLGNWLTQFNPVEKIWKKFLNAAFLPTLVAIPLTVGFIMVNAGLQMDPIPAQFQNFNNILPLFVGVTDFWQLLWMFIAMFILWSGVFMVLKQDEMIGAAVEPIKQFGQAAGKLALKAPLAAPIAPIPGAPTALQLGRVLDPKRWLGDIEEDGRIGRKDEPIGVTMKRIMGMPSPTQVDGAARAIQGNQQTVNNVRNHVQVIVNAQNAANSQATQNALRDALQRVKENHPEHNNLSEETLTEAIIKALEIRDEDHQSRIRAALNVRRNSAGGGAGAGGGGGAGAGGGGAGGGAGGGGAGGGAGAGGWAGGGGA